MSCNDDALQEGVIGNGVAVSVSEISAYPTGDIIAFLVTSDRDWHIDNIPYWITVVPSSGRAGSTKVNISAAFNDEKADRGTVLFVDAEDGSYSISIPVNQEYPYFRLNRLEGYDFLWSDNASMTNRMVHIDVECNTEWTLRPYSLRKEVTISGFQII